MATTVFIQRSRLGRRIYQLHGSKLTVSGRFWSKEFNLYYISPKFVRLKRRVPRLFQVPLLLACVCGLIIRGLSFLPEDPYFAIIIVPCYLIGIFLWQAYKGFAPLEVVFFTNTNKRIQFDIVKDEKQGADFEGFVTALVDSIDNARDSATERLRSELPAVSVPQRRIPYWLYSVISGGMALSWPLVSHFVCPLGGFLFPLTFLCTLGGVWCAFVSFSKAERLRILSLVGAAAGLLPPFLYRS
jgi:hypothetical protein